MKRKNFIIAVILCCSSVIILNAQNKDKAVFKESRPGFYQNSNLRDDREVKEKIEPARPNKSFAVDLTNVALPNKIDLYKNRQWQVK
jgi:bleomycin hydrolase